MGQLTGYLQLKFREYCPRNWQCSSETPLLDRELTKILGYAPRADVVLTECDTMQRLWIEFEVSRADPVANHAKFATGHLFKPLAENDIFVSMVSRHVDRGRRNLAANTIRLMRHIGMQAIQTVLFPKLEGLEVKRFNHLKRDELLRTGPDARPEIERVFAVTTPQADAEGHRIYLAGEIVDVLLNAQAWNREVSTKTGRQQWGRRRVQYFVFVPYSGEFAPCKFCAFLPIRPATPGANITDTYRMTMSLYVQLDETETRFDGGTAQRHLADRLGMGRATAEDNRAVGEMFHHWLRSVQDLITVPAGGPIFLIPTDA